MLGLYSDCNYEATIREVHHNGDTYIVDWADGDQLNRELHRSEVVFSLYVAFARGNQRSVATHMTRSGEILLRMNALRPRG